MHGHVADVRISRVGNVGTAVTRRGRHVMRNEAGDVGSGAAYPA